MSAGAAKRMTCQSGKFQGMTASTGPMGWYFTNEPRLAAVVVTGSSASMDAACSA